METLKEKTAKGMFWGGMNNIVQQFIGLAIGIVLGRLLSPDDYGLMAMILVISLIATAIQNSGFSVGIINMKQPTHNDYNSVFWFNLLMGSSLYILLFICSPLISWYYNEPRLTWLCRYAFLSIPFSSLTTAQLAYLTKNMRNREIAKSGMASVVMAGIIGAVMAYLGFGYWSLATQSLGFNVFMSLVIWHYSDWRPTLRIDFGPVRRMFRFSVKILATNILTHVNNNILNILLGKYYSSTATGYYNQAYQWDSKLFNLVQGMIMQVAQPMLVSLNDQPARQLNALRKMMRFTAFLSFPLLMGFGLVAHEFISIAITDKWLPAARLIQILCLAGAVIPLHTVLSYVVISKGRSDINFWCTISLGLIEILTMITIWRLGITTMVAAYSLINIVWVLVWHFFVRRLIGYSLVQLFKDVMPFALAAAAVMITCHFATIGISNTWILLLTRITMSMLLYFAVMKLAHAKILDECLAFALSKVKR